MACDRDRRQNHVLVDSPQDHNCQGWAAIVNQRSGTQPLQPQTVVLFRSVICLQNGEWSQATMSRYSSIECECPKEAWLLNQIPNPVCPSDTVTICTFYRNLKLTGDRFVAVFGAFIVTWNSVFFLAALWFPSVFFLLATWSHGRQWQGLSFLASRSQQMPCSIFGAWWTFPQIILNAKSIRKSL